MPPRLPRAALPVALIASALAAGCAPPTIRQASSAHLTADAAPEFAGPPLQPVTQAWLPRPPRPSSQDETYSVVVNKVRVHDLLFALARDARLNVDIHAGIDGEVTLNAIDQTLPQLLKRIARQVEMRIEIDGPNLVVTPDTPFLRNYAVDYVNMSRDTTGSLAVATQLVGSVTGNATAAPGSGNNSSTRIENKAQHRFWETLIQNIRDILRETDRIIPEGNPIHAVDASPMPAAAAPPTPTPGKPRRSAPDAAEAQPPVPPPSAPPSRNIFREAASVIAHPETGTLGVRATSRQHEKVQEFLDRVLASARRQVMIEATLVEVQLSNNYQQGIDWSRVATGTGFGLALSGPVAAAPGLFTLSYRNDSFTGMVKLLDSFGTTRVLSSPKLSVLNNQTAVLKVVDNSVYFCD